MVRGSGNGWLREKRGKKLYCYYNSEGRERSKTLGDLPMTDAQAWLLIAELGLTQSVGQPDPHNATFGDVMQMWLEYAKTKTGEEKEFTTRTTEQLMCTNYLSYWSNTIAKDNQPMEIQTWLDNQPRGVRSKIRTLMSAIYKFGQKNGWIPRNQESNPMPWVSAPETSQYEAVSISGKEAAAIIRQLADPLLRSLVILIAVTGMRVSEALALTWENIDWQKGKIRILRKTAYGKYGKPKSKMSGQPVEMTSALAAILQIWRGETIYAKETDLLFPSYKLKGASPRTKSMAAKVVRRAAIGASVLELKNGKTFYEGKLVRRFGFHNMRHGIATWLAEKGTDPVVIQRMLRHSDTKMTMHYIHATKPARDAQEQYLKELQPAVIDSGYSSRVQ